MRRLAVIMAALFAFGLLAIGPAGAGPSGSTECHVQDDDCDGAIDEDTGAAAQDDDDGDGRVDEDPVGDANGDGIADDDGDGRVDEDRPDDDGDGSVDEDPVGDGADDPKENQVDCNEGSSTNVGGAGYLYAGTNGAEICADEGSAVPVDGRVIVSDEGYAAIDGDGNNPAPANGYARLDADGVHCGDTENQDSGADQSGNTAEDCG